MDIKRVPERHTGNCETSHFLMTESRPAVYSTERERFSLRALIPNRWRTSISCDRITYETRILERLDELILMRRAHYCRRVYIGIPRHCSLHVAGNQWAVMLIQSSKPSASRGACDYTPIDQAARMSLGLQVTNRYCRCTRQVGIN